MGTSPDGPCSFVVVECSTHSPSHSPSQSVSPGPDQLVPIDNWGRSPEPTATFLCVWGQWHVHCGGKRGMGYCTTSWIVHLGGGAVAPHHSVFVGGGGLEGDWLV